MIKTADQNLIRKLNKAVVLNLLRHQAPLSRAEVAHATGLNRATISAIINDLLLENLVRETVFQSDRIGRPGMLLELNPLGGFALGIELGVDFISIVVTDFTAQVLWRQRAASNPGDGQELILKHAFALTEEGIREGQSRNLRPLGIGIGVPGLIDQHTGGLKFAPNLGWKNTPLHQLWNQRFNLPVFVQNEAKAAALGEYYFGEARGIEDFIFLNAGVGLGSGIMIGGKLLRGSQGYASEIGHIIMDPNGIQCGCGRRGCWETQAGPRAVVQRFIETLKQGIPSTVLNDVDNITDNITFEGVANAALQGDNAALKAMQEVGEHLGFGIANLVNIFNPQLIVLGGELNYASETLLPIIRKVILNNALNLEDNNLRVVASAFGRDACVMGAVALVLDDILHDQSSN